MQAAGAGVVRLALLTVLTVVAFAANSVLTRLALAEGAMTPFAFAAVRTATGAAVLGGLVLLRGARLGGGARGLGPALALAGYMLGFTYAYIALDTGTGALILFGSVQVGLFGAALGGGERVGARRWAGAALALAGILVLFWPPDLSGGSLAALSMAAAGASWTWFTVLGRRARDPLAATARAFCLALPVVLVPPLLASLGPAGPVVTGPGLALAALSGGVTSGLGYALWYSLLPQLRLSTAALAQLSAPFLAAAAGVLLLGEAATLRLALSGAAILGGVALGLLPQRTRGSSGS